MPAKRSRYCEGDALKRLHFALPFDIAPPRASKPDPTVYRWNCAPAPKRQGLLAKKVFSFLAISPHNAIPRHKTANSNHNVSEAQHNANRLRHKQVDFRHKTAPPSPQNASSSP